MIKKYIVITNGGNLNIRSSASLSSAVVGSMPNGTVFESAAAPSGGWLSIAYAGTAGYVSTDWIREYSGQTVPSTNQPTPTEPTTTDTTNQSGNTAGTNWLKYGVIACASLLGAYGIIKFIHNN